MANGTTKTVPRAKSAARSLPVVTLAKLEEGMALIERMVDEHTATFVRNGQLYRDRHREGTRRPLTAAETAQIAAGLGTTLADADAQIAEAGITHYDEPESNEVLMAAGVATGTAFLGTVTRLACLLELPNDAMHIACEADRLYEVLDAAASEWRDLPLDAARERAACAMKHFAAAAGFDSGKALALAARAVWEGLWTAMSHLDASESRSSTGSAPGTAGDAPTSFTTLPG